MSIRKITDRVLSESHSLPTFSVENITVHHARVDRFEVKFDQLKIHYRREPQFDSITSAMRDSLLFQVEGQKQDSFSIRKDFIVSCEPFKFGWQSGREGNYHRPFSIKFNGNLNRFIAHQPIFSNESCTRRNPNWSQTTAAEEAFIGSPEVESRLSSAALDTNDNYLVRGYWDEGQDFTYWLERYFSQLQSLMLANMGIDTGLASNASADDIPDLLAQEGKVAVLDFSNWFVPYLEICWDFKSSNAIGFIKRIEPAFRRASREFIRNEYAVADEDDALPENQDPVSIERINNTYALTAKISKHLSIRLYAKTRQRIRMEVVFNARRKGLNEFVRRYTGGTKATPFCTDAPIHGLPYNIAGFAHFAVEYVARPFFEAVTSLDAAAQGMPADIPVERLERFLEVLHRATDGNTKTGARLLEILSQHGSIVRTGDAALDHPIDCLVNAKILQRITTARREPPKNHLFGFTPDYQSLQHLSCEGFLRVLYEKMRAEISEPA